MTTRARRHAAIRRILQTHAVSSQEELVRLLEREGIRCTQATLSRDLRALPVVRRATPEGGVVYRLDREAEYHAALRKVVGMEIRSVRHNGHLVVIRTLSGRAEGVAGYLDRRADGRILGTVAGDDTVFVAPASVEDTAALAAEIAALVDPQPAPDEGREEPP